MTTIISFKQLKRQKKTIIVFSIFLIIIGIFMLNMAFLEEEYMVLFALPICIILPVQFFNDLKRICSISYDSAAVYYKKLASPKTKMVSFENIKSITIGRFDYTYRINLIKANEDGSCLYFRKPIFWLPFVHHGVLENVYILRDQIDACKKRENIDYTGQTQIFELV